ncbi:hypothetical protein Barb7_01153 [Bacteroidales bacterium Barb7]|nr:hypothetical protein Barb7_01153 [Bacteroidales bacterium Barb7]
MISFFQNSLMMLFLAPHSAALHVGLKSLAPSGHLRNISNYYFSTVKLDIVTLFLSVTSACVNRAIAR